MATFTDPAAFAKHIASFGPKIQAAEPMAVRAGALAATRLVRAEGARFRIKGRPLGAKFDGPTRSVGGASAIVSVRPPGLWRLTEFGSYKKPQGWLEPRRGRRRGGRARVMTTPYGLFPVVHHPHIGPIGHPWETAVQQAKVVVPKVMSAAIVKAVS